MTMNAQTIPLILLLVVMIARQVTGEPPFTAMYVFGDSFSDSGNNINFHNSIARADFSPYGIDFQSGPTGRFSNGKILVDMLAELLGLPILPSYANGITNGDDILSGVNYASAGAGILEETGYAFGRVSPLGAQIDNFKDTLNQLRDQMQDNELSNYLAKALVFVEMGVNDYLNNYFQPQVYPSSHIYTPDRFAALLIQRYAEYISNLHSLGLRKFFLVELPPTGCSPILLSMRPAPPGQCEQSSNDMIQMFNTLLKSLVDQLNSDYPDSIFSRAAAYQLFMDLRDNADDYGFTVKDAACCGIGRNGGSKLLCLPNSEPCLNRDQYLFWDAAHLTEAANRVLVDKVYNNSAYSFPITIEQMASM